MSYRGFEFLVNCIFECLRFLDISVSIVHVLVGRISSNSMIFVGYFYIVMSFLLSCTFKVKYNPNISNIYYFSYSSFKKHIPHISDRKAKNTPFGGGRGLQLEGVRISLVCHDSLANSALRSKEIKFKLKGRQIRSFMFLKQIIQIHAYFVR